MLRVALAALLAAIWIPSSWAGAEPPMVTEAEFLAALDEGHPAFAVLEEAVGLARADVADAETLENPELDIAREDPSGATEQVEVAVSWQLPNRARRRLSVAAAARRNDAARANTLVDRLDVRLALRRSFAQWAAATARGERFRVQVDRIVELAARERRRAERGESSGLEARRLELAAVKATSALALAEAAALRAGGTARGWRPDLAAVAVPELPDLPQPAVIEPFEHPRLTALAAERDAARLASQAADFLVRWPKLVAGWQRQEATSESIDGPILGLSWALPVADRRRAERGRASTRLDGAEARLELARQQVEAEQAATLEAYLRLAEASASSASTLTDNERLAEAAVKAFHYGESSLTDLLDVLRSIFEAELAALDLHDAALAAHRDLERAAGRALGTADSTDPALKEPLP